MPRPLRSWGDGEHGISGLSQFEKEQVYIDDVLLLRFLLLYVISEEVRKANQEPQPTTIMIEQPADLAQMPEVVTLWRTKIWKRLANLYQLQTQTFNQSEFACKSTKPTTIGGTMRIHVPMPGRRGLPREVEGKTKEELCQESKGLSRWPPLMMREIATSIQVDTMKGEVKMRALSWKEHVAAGHTPFRKDCLVCQEAFSQRLPPSKKQGSTTSRGFKPRHVRAISLGHRLAWKERKIHAHRSLHMACKGPNGR